MAQFIIHTKSNFTLFEPELVESWLISIEALTHQPACVCNYIIRIFPYCFVPCCIIISLSHYVLFQLRSKLYFIKCIKILNNHISNFDAIRLEITASTKCGYYKLKKIFWKMEGSIGQNSQINEWKKDLLSYKITIEYNTFPVLQVQKDWIMMVNSKRRREYRITYNI